MGGVRVALLAVLMAVPVAAQETQPLAWAAEHRALAGHLSDGSVAAAIALDTAHSVRTHTWKPQACRMGLTIGTTEIVKRVVNRTRPDGSDRSSFWSEHTAVAMQASGWRFSIGVPIAIGAGYFRMAANKHYASDVAAGALMGFVAQKVCPK